VTVVGQVTGTSTVRFDVMPSRIGPRTILRLPEEASKKMPSRGQVAVEGAINGYGFQTVLEPDGDLGHWMKIGETMQRAAGLRVGVTARVEIAPLKEWPEPRLPRDLEGALAAAPQKVRDQWIEITPMARWEWVRWVKATRNPETRKRRVEVSISKMKNGKRRPCCFNLASCTDPNLSKNGKLIAPA
jgi:Bacteriocin-protection, YdeI or OmpD-Associated/Domain of unknown function (DUF1905)